MALLDAVRLLVQEDFLFFVLADKWKSKPERDLWRGHSVYILNVFD